MNPTSTHHSGMRSPKPTNASGSETGKGRACLAATCSACVPGALRLVVDDHVLRRHRGLVAEVLLHVVLDVADESLAATAGRTVRSRWADHAWALHRLARHSHAGGPFEI